MPFHSDQTLLIVYIFWAEEHFKMILYDNIVCLGSLVFNLFSSVCLQNLYNRNMGMNLYNNIIYLLPFSLIWEKRSIEQKRSVQKVTCNSLSQLLSLIHWTKSRMINIHMSLMKVILFSVLQCVWICCSSLWCQNVAWTL